MQSIDPVRVEFGHRLAAARKAQGLTQDRVAGEMGVKKATVSAWETGRGDPGALGLGRLARLYQRSADTLLFGGGPSAEAYQFAQRFDALTEQKKRQFTALWLAFISTAADDATVESKMPATKHLRK